MDNSLLSVVLCDGAVPMAELPLLAKDASVSNTVAGLRFP
jgi:hypothetical protein